MPEILLKRFSNQKQPTEMVCKKDVLKKFTKFTGKHLFFQAFNFIEKETLAKEFFRKCCEFLETLFLIEHFRWLLLSNTGIFI